MTIEIPITGEPTREELEKQRNECHARAQHAELELLNARERIADLEHAVRLVRLHFMVRPENRLPLAERNLVGLLRELVPSEALS